MMRAESDALRIADLPGRGRGFVATRAVQPGELLLREVPFSVAYEHRLEMVRAVLQEERFARLCFDEARPLCRSALAAEGVSDTQWSDACARVKSNVFMTHEGALCIYGGVSMFNHSCAPNASMFTQRSCNALPGLLRPPPPGAPAREASPAEEARIFAICAIERDQEVTLAYRADWLAFPAPLRRRLLKRSWHFDCDCARCAAEQPTGAAVHAAGGAADSVPGPALLARAAQLYRGIDAGGATGDGDIHPATFRRADPAMDTVRLAELRRLLVVWPARHWVGTVVRSELLAWALVEGGAMGADELCALLREQVRVEQALLPRLHHFRLRAARALVRAAGARYRACDDGIDWRDFEEMRAACGMGVEVEGGAIAKGETACRSPGSAHAAASFEGAAEARTKEVREVMSGGVTDAHTGHSDT
jgi:hypothetical protein